jgi:hypothetical protein
MPIHDTWHFENSPVGTQLCVGTYGSAYNGNTIYNQYTGNPGQPVYASAINTFVVTSDNFLTLTANSGGQCGALYLPLNVVQDWSVATQYWMGFRTKLNASYGGATCYIAMIANNVSYGAFTSLLTEAQMTAAGLNTVGVEHYIEIFMDRVALTYQVYADGALILSGALTAANMASGAGMLSFGPITTGLTAGGARGYRDFYFLDVDATKTPTRLGPIRAKAATIAAVAGSEWVANGAADVPTALGTALQNPPLMTPNAGSPADKQPLVLTLSTTASDAQVKILGVQPAASLYPNNQAGTTVAVGFQDTIGNPLVPAGSFSSAGAINQFNQKLPMVTTGPNGQPWTAAEINKSQMVLTPQ